MESSEKAMESRIKAYFDGKCNLCSRSVRFANSRTDNVEFLSLQSDEGKEILDSSNLDSEDFETFILQKDDDLYFRSDAVIELMKEFGGIWRIISIGISLVPRSVRDKFYRLISRHRFKIFGRRDTCFNL